MRSTRDVGASVRPRVGGISSRARGVLFRRPPHHHHCYASTSSPSAAALTSAERVTAGVGANAAVLYPQGPLALYFGILVGYIVGDLYILVQNRATMDNVRDTVFHHVLAVMAFVMVGHLRIFQWYGAMVIFFEASTPLVNLRWFVSKSNDPTWGKPSVLHVLCGVGMTGGFFVVRLLGIPRMVSVIVEDWNEVGGAAGFGALVESKPVIAAKLPRFFPAGMLMPAADVFYFLSCSLNTWWFYLMFTGLIRVGRKTLCPAKKKGE